MHYFQSFLGNFMRRNTTTKPYVTSQPNIEKSYFFVSNKSYDIGLSCNNTYFTTTITSYAVEGVAIVFLHPVYGQNSTPSTHLIYTLPYKKLTFIPLPNFKWNSP